MQHFQLSEMLVEDSYLDEIGDVAAESLPALHCLHLHSCWQVSGAGIQALSRLTTLKALELNTNWDIRDEALLQAVVDEIVGAVQAAV